MICWSIKQEFNNLSWNSKCPSSNTIKCHGPFKPQALLTSTWLISTSSLPSKHCCSHGGCPFFKSHLWPNSPMPQACLINIMTLFFHRNVELINHQRSSSKTEMTLQPSCFLKFTTYDETYLRRLLEGPLHMEITLIPDLHAISLNKICNKYSIYNCYLGIYKQRKWKMRKKE